MRIEGRSRVRMMPVQAAFPYPLNPEFRITDYPYEYGVASASNASQCETNLDLQCLTTRPIFVPHNNTVAGKAADAVSGWYNTNLVGFEWTENSAGPRLAYMGDIWTTPWVKSVWTDEPARAVFYAYLPADQGVPGTRYDYDPYDSDIDLRSPDMTAQGFYLQLGAELDGRQETWSSSGGVWTSTFTFPGESDTRPYLRLRIRIDSYTGVAGTWITFERQPSGHVKVYQSSDVSSLGTLIREVVPTAQPAQVVGTHSYGYMGYYGWYGYGDGQNKMVRVRLLGGHLLVEGFGGDPILIGDMTVDSDDVQSPHSFIRQVVIQGQGVRSIQLGLAPMKWVQAAQWEGQDIQVGFDTTGLTIGTRLHFAFAAYEDGTNAIPATTATVTAVSNGAIINYVLDMGGTLEGTYNDQNYAAGTPVVRAVTLEIAETLNSPIGWSEELHPISVEVQQGFDFDNLLITQSATLTFANFSEISAIHDSTSPDVWWGEFIQGAGAAAIEISFAVDLYNPDGSLYSYGTWYTVFTGYGFLRSTTTMDVGGQSKCQVQCMGREISMMGEAFALPFFDGWNVYAAAAYLANLGGVKKGTISNTDLAFRHLVPNDPYDDSPGGGAYFLPLGTGGTPLQRYPGGCSPWSVMDRMLKPIGYLRYFDVFGKFHVEPWQLTSTLLPYRVFHVWDNESEGQYGVLPSAIFSGVVERDLTEVRNLVTVIGIDAFGPAWDPIVVHVADPDSFLEYSPDPWAARGSNYLGFKRPLVWVDSQFANLSYATAAAASVAAVVMAPSVTASISSWLQPDLFPMYRIGIKDFRTGLYDRGAGAYLEMMVISVNHRVAQGEVPRTDLGLRYIPPLP